ncbi:hypothetical protein Zm00014a_031021 [Zea mays]|uniref:Uncharacterized protein n=1 Tax=Zea mays TaxID=4577 RepID=A0A3L6FM65_MAIZE|nr:hypothetical protein Zm00014a_031021 [Zea mays]
MDHDKHPAPECPHQGWSKSHPLQERLFLVGQWAQALEERSYRFRPPLQPLRMGNQGLTLVTEGNRLFLSHLPCAAMWGRILSPSDVGDGRATGLTGDTSLGCADVRHSYHGSPSVISHRGGLCVE